MFKEFRDNAIGFADLLPYHRMVRDGVLLGKAGQLMAGFHYRGADTESATNAELELIVRRLNAALMQYGSKWMMHFDAIRFEAVGYPKLGDFPDKTTALMDSERRIQYEGEGDHYESVYALTVTYLPPSELEMKARTYLFEQSDDIKAQMGSVEKRTVDRFDAAMEDMEGQLRSVFDGVSRMRSRVVLDETTQREYRVDDFLAYLNYCVTGVNQDVRLPDVPTNLDVLIGCQDFTGGMEPAIGSKRIRVVSIEGFPFSGHAGVLNALNSLPINYRWNSRFIFFDTEEAKTAVNKLQKKWRQKIRGFKDQLLNNTSGPVDEDSLGMMQDANGAMAEAASGLVRHGHYTPVVVLMDEDSTRLDESTAIALKAIRDSGFTCRLETVNSIEAYLGSMPGEGVCNVRRPIIHTLNLATLLPTTASWQGLEYNPCPFYPPKSPPLFYAQTTGSAPFRVGLHVSDVGHTLILGPTGSGKSTLLQFIQAQQFRYPEAKVFAFDKGYSAFVLCHAAGGRHYDIASEHESLSFCPLARVDEPQERMWAADWIETLLAVNQFKVLPNHRNIINHSLKLIGKADPSQRTMSHFVASLPDMSMREALESSTVAGGNELLDGEIDDLKSSARFQVFEMENLMELGEKHVIPALLYLFHHVQRQFDGTPTLLVLDEAWLMLAHPLFQEKIKEWLKVLRKANVGVVFATQSISDIGNSPIRDVIYESCQTKILLPNPSARENENSLVQYRAIGLNERQIDLIASAQPKRDYYYMSPLGKRMFRLGLGRVSLAFVGTSDKEAVKAVRDLMARHGDDWVPHWLEVRGLARWAREWRSLDRRQIAA